MNSGSKTITVFGDFTGEDTRIIYGKRYDFEVEFPGSFSKIKNGADYTAYLTVARAKFAFGLSGDFEFKIKTGVVGSMTKWDTATVVSEPYTNADIYLADTATMDFSNIFTVPIHQRNSNFLLKLTSDSPYPLSLDSCMWKELIHHDTIGGLKSNGERRWKTSEYLRLIEQTKRFFTDNLLENIQSYN